MRLAQQITDRATELADKYEVPEHLNTASRKLSEVSEKVYDRMSTAGEAAKRGAAIAYRAALDNPKTSIAGVVLAAALVGGALWFVFGNWRKVPIQRRRHGTRVRAGNERRRRGRAARPAAA